MITKEEREEELYKLEQRKVKALEKVANSLDALTIWFEEINKQEWSDRVQFYLAEWHKTIQPEDVANLITEVEEERFQLTNPHQAIKLAILHKRRVEEVRNKDVVPIIACVVVANKTFYFKSC